MVAIGPFSILVNFGAQPADRVWYSLNRTGHFSPGISSFHSRTATWGSKETGSPCRLYVSLITTGGLGGSWT